MSQHSLSPGNLLNLLTCDVDRVVNITQSIHALWSLPLQLIVVLWLLWGQLGLGALAGVGVVVVMIPINKLLADKIGSLSQTLMKHKDSRVSFTTQLVSMIRTLKMTNLDQLFISRICDSRALELRALATRKYLDAACVYFWAATPVLVPVAAFSVA